MLEVAVVQFAQVHLVIIIIVYIGLLPSDLICQTP